MGKVWLQLLTAKSIEIRGKMTNFHAGDWVQIGGHLASTWLANGTARTTGGETTKLLEGCGIVVRGNKQEAQRLDHQGMSYTAIGDGDFTALPYPKTLVWHPSVTLRFELLPAGFGLLDKWECAIPMAGVDILALHVGNKDEREQTKAVVHDLRVPVFDSRLIFVKRCPVGRALIEMFAKEKGNKELALLRAIYRAKPTMCALPATWVGGSLG